MGSDKKHASGKKRENRSGGRGSRGNRNQTGSRKNVKSHDRKRRRRKKTNQDRANIYGINPIVELLEAGNRQVYRILIEQNKMNDRIKRIISLAEHRSIEVKEVSREHLNSKTSDAVHQGALAVVKKRAQLNMQGFLKKINQKNSPYFLLGIDEIQDPQNLGALMRSAESGGVDGVIIPKRRNAMPDSPAAAKTSAGAIEYVNVLTIGSMQQAIQELKKYGVWAIGLDPSAKGLIFDVDLTKPLALIVGNEAKGLSRMVRNRCDLLVSLPMRGNLNSLNTSVAGGMAIYEVVRQRIMKEREKKGRK